MKIYVSKIKESWIVDRIRDEWYESNKNISTKYLRNADIIWVLAPWLWKKISQSQLKQKKVLCTYHHINLESEDEVKNFHELDKFVHEYHSISIKTENDLRKLTNKKITTIPLWVNTDNWFSIKDKGLLRKKYNFKEEDYLVGSFQRDTEGKDLVSPKLIKGPDIFLSLIINIYKSNKNLKVVLTGTRRQYLLNELKKNKIPHVYFEMLKINEINEMYNLLDLYLVTSRIEGGPQAIVECGIIKTPIISTNVGIAPEILSPDSLFDISKNNFEDAVPDVDFAYENSNKLTLPNITPVYIDMFKSLYED
tara:strand:+ start:12215 stop:13138 length:924 start_codon:yes stop_codon:yes gene_type:complete